MTQLCLQQCQRAVSKENCIGIKKARRKHCTLQYYNNFLKAQDSHMLHKDLCSPTMIIFSVLSDNQAFNHPKSSKQS